MAIDSQSIINYKSNSRKFAKCKNIHDVLSELLVTQNDSLDFLKEKQCKDVVEYILWNDFVNDKGTLANKINATYRRYVWGDKVFVDFGMTNIQTELSYPHPAIILYNLANTVIVTPTTSDDKVVDFTDDINQCIIKVKKDGNIFPNDTI
ncbi:MAG TPA: hypothetical protein DDY59_09835, partial [Lachnospiraceae bacterium]|nr:hypothetical protein [Lachnospiraceae bacterium]HCA69244.1 hypothetical protein [Lachnospiraceae bacterium]